MLGIRYSGKNNSEGYAYGVDTRLFGEFVPGVDSWISVSYARAKKILMEEAILQDQLTKDLDFPCFIKITCRNSQA